MFNNWRMASLFVAFSVCRSGKELVKLVHLQAGGGFEIS